MYGNRPFAITTLLILLSFGNAKTQVIDPRIEKARQFLDLLVQGDYQKAVEPFDSVMSARMTAGTLMQVWDALQQQVGAYRESKNFYTEFHAPYFSVYLTCRFEKTTVDMKVVFDPRERIAGLFFLPAKSRSWKIPYYADTSRFTVRPVEIITDTFHLKGELTIPVGVERYPIVVLVHGSGPQDMDETILSNKVFRDIAWGLSSQGIGVLRYNKRTLTYGSLLDPAKITVDNEVVADAVSAVKFAMDQQPGKGVYLLGHSLGGYLAPRIAQQINNLDGIILLAANARPLEELIYEQVNYLLGLDGFTSQDSLELESLAKKISLVKSRAFSVTASPSTLPLGLPASYWLSLRYYDPVATARMLDIPMLIMQGEADYQVTMKDLSLWKDGLKEKNRVSFSSFPGLNHLFMKGPEKSVPDDYFKPGHLSADVIETIAAWIKSLSGG